MKYRRYPYAKSRFDQETNLDLESIYFVVGIPYLFCEHDQRWERVVQKKEEECEPCNKKRSLMREAALLGTIKLDD